MYEQILLLCLSLSSVATLTMTSKNNTQSQTSVSLCDLYAENQMPWNCENFFNVASKTDAQWNCNNNHALQVIIVSYLWKTFIHGLRGYLKSVWLRDKSLGPKTRTQEKLKYSHTQLILSNPLPLGSYYIVTNSWKPLKGGDGNVTCLGCVWLELELRLVNGSCVKLCRTHSSFARETNLLVTK